MPAAVLRPGLPDASAGRHREMQVPIRLVLSREVRNVPAHAGGARVQLDDKMHSVVRPICRNVAHTSFFTFFTLIICCHFALYIRN